MPKLITDVIGEHSNDRKYRQLFNPKNSETVQQCLQRRISIFDHILNRKVSVSKIVNHAEKSEYEMNLDEKIAIFQRVQGLRLTYLYAIQHFKNRSFLWKICCKKAINDMIDTGNFLIGRCWQTISKWNRIFRINELFPHPNISIEMGKSYMPPFFEDFPEAKMKIRRWSNQNLGHLSCENVAVYMRVSS